ncbi:Gfo/Idh/MocA family oxidoreductase [Streptomyces sp. NPDC005898]|uniref:Gfo/Idh/MocA family protein n=1 Tax=Streptomyces sp. NPDC005898 TaxID=3157082 RepID=UPI0034002FD6
MTSPGFSSVSPLSRLSPSSPVRVGLVGLSARGGWASRSHLPALSRLKGYELRALSASSEASARAAGEKYGVPLAFGSTGELVRSDEVDLVVVSVRVPLHREAVLAALDAGKAVLCEWPLGNGLAEAEELAAAADRAGVRTFVGLQARSAPPVRYVRELVAEGRVGEVLSTSLVASGRGWGPTFEPSGAYLLDERNGATMLTIPFGHTVDALTMALGEFTEVSATLATRRPVVREAGTGRAAPMTAADQVAMSGRLASGAVVSAHFRSGLSRGTNFHWEINGTDGDLVVTGESGHLQQAAVTVRGGRGTERGLTALPVPARHFAVPELDELRAVPSYEVAYNVGAQYARILGDLTEGTAHTPDFAHAVRRHRLLDAIGRAAATGTRVTV